MNPEVLIVDDDEVIIYLHKRIISENKFHTSPKGFLSVEESLEYISSNMDHERAYIVLLDINLPSMDGWDFLDYISEHQLSNHILVVMVTSSIDVADKEKAKLYKQVIDYLEKPVNHEKLDQLKSHQLLANFYKSET